MKKGGGNHSHSWWWDSHINPKNSKWLEENLEGMDTNVKTMLKLIEEDADSFAKKAEMYYKKRPELISLVEESFRIYRSLAERYDHLTGELRKNIPSSLKAEYGLSDDSSPGSQHDVKTKSKRRAARFDFFLGSSSTDHSRKSADSSDESSSTASSDTEPEDSLKPHLELQRLKEENEKQRTEFEKVKEEYEGLQQKIRELQEGILNLKEENEFLRKEAAGESGHRENLQEQITGLEARNSDLESQIRSILVEVGDSAGKIVVLQKEDEKLTEELQSEVKINQELEREIQDLQVKLFSSQEENNVSKLEFQRCLEDYRVAEKRISEIETDTSAQKEQIYTLESEIDDLKHKLGEMQEENNVLSMQNEVGIQKLNYAEREIKKLQEEVLKLQGEKEKLSGEVVENEAQKKDMRAELSFLQEDNGRLRNELVIMQQRMKDHEDAMSHLLMEKENIRNEASGQMDSMQDQLRYLEKELQSRTEKVQVLEKHTEELQLTLLDSQSENARLTGEYNRGIDEYDALNERLKALQEELLHTQEENERLRKENSAKIFDLNDLEVLYSSLIKDKERLQAELLVKGSMVGGMEKHLNDLKEQNQISTQEQKEQIRALQETIIPLQDQNKTLTDQLLGSLEKQHELETRFKGLEEENRRLQSELADLRVVAQKWEKDAHILESEKAALESGITSGKVQLNALKEKCCSFYGDAEHLAIQLQAEPEQQKTFDKEILDVEQLILHIKEVYVNLKTKSHEGSEVCQKLTEELAELQKELIFVRSENNSLKLEISNQEELVKKLNTDYISLHNENETLKNEISNGVDQIQKFEEEYKDLRKKTEEMAALQSEVTSGKEQLHALKEICHSFYGNAEQLTIQLQAKQEQQKTFNEEVLELEQLIFCIKEEYMHFKTKFHERSEVCQKLTGELEDLEKELLVVHSENNSLKLEKSNQEEFVKKLNTDCISLHSENEKLNNEISNGIDQIQKLKKECDNLRNRLEEMARLKDEENLILQKSLHNLQEENEKLRGELQNAFKDNEKNLFVVKEELLQWRDKNTNLEQQELEQLTGSMKLEKTTLEADYQEVCEQLKACQHMLKVLQEEHSGLADQRNSLLSEVSSKRAYICKLEEEVLILNLYVNPLLKDHLISMGSKWSGLFPLK